MEFLVVFVGLLPGVNVGADDQNLPSFKMS